MTMVDRYERVDVFSSAEYQRRIRGIRDILRERGLDAAVFLECSEETYAQWLMGVRFLEYMIVPAEGEVLGVLWDEAGPGAGEEPDFDRYLFQRPIRPVCGGLRFTDCQTDERVVSYLASLRPEKLGLVSPKRMTAGFAAALQKQLPKIVCEDISVPVAVFRAVKSEEEFAAIETTRNAQVKIFEALPMLVREGRRPSEITSDIHYMLASMGGSGVMSAMFVNNGPTDDMLSEHTLYGDRPVTPGDRMFVLLEGNAAGQQHVAFGRHLVWGEPSAQMLRFVEDEIRAHKYAASLMRADGETTLAKIAVKTRKFINSMGYMLQEQVGWNWMHSLGAFFYEQFSIEDYTENEPLRENIILHCHPVMYSYYTENERTLRREVFILNTYRVTKEGPKDLIRVPFEPVILG